MGALVVAGRGENQVLIVDDGCKNRDFRADEALLDKHAPGTEAALGEYLVKELQRGGFIRTDRHAFSGGESVEFQHGRVDSGDRGGGLFDRVGGHAACGGDAVSDEEFLGELLARLELRGLLRRPPAWDAVPRTEVCKPLAFHQVALLTGDAEIDGIGIHPCDERLQTIGIHRLGDFENRIAAGETKQLGISRRFRQSPHQRVFAPAFANDQYSHPQRFSRNPGQDSTPNRPKRRRISIYGVTTDQPRAFNSAKVRSLAPPPSSNIGLRPIKSSRWANPATSGVQLR